MLLLLFLPLLFGDGVIVVAVVAVVAVFVVVTVACVVAIDSVIVGYCNRRQLFEL